MDAHRLFFLGALLLFCSCSADPNYRKIDSYLSRDRCAQAVAYLEECEDDYGSNDRLLYLMDSAMVHLQCRNLAQAQQHFHAAEDLAQTLWTESISRNVLSMVTNDYVLPYQGEDFERVMIHLFSAIGYLEENNLEEALVECRRLDSLLASYNANYEEENAYKEDALARYLSGMLHEADRSLDDAFIDYYKSRKAYNDYQALYGTSVPKILEEDLLRIAQAVDRRDDALKIVGKGKKSSGFSMAQTAQMGRIVFVQFSGNAPRKTEEKLYIPTKYGPITIAFPKFVIEPPTCRPDQIILSSERETIQSEMVLVENINQIAVKNLEDRKTRVIAKAIARAVAKQALINELTRETKGSAKEMIRLAFNIANMLLLEKADTRSWRTLPGEIYLSRAFVRPGTYTIQLPRCGTDGIPSVTVKAGETRFVFQDSRY